MSDDEASLTRALRVLAGKAPSLAGSSKLPSTVRQGVFVFVDAKTNTSVAIVAQRRGRYVVLTYTRGSAVKLPSGYHDLEAGPDTSRAADAATTALAQLTDAVVSR